MPEMIFWGRILAQGYWDALMAIKEYFQPQNFA